jgi:hypothetical protein
MATIKKPRGRMTRPLVTSYEVGDVVLLTQSDHQDGEYIGFTGDRRYVPRVGDVGVIKRIRRRVRDRVDGEGRRVAPYVAVAGDSVTAGFAIASMTSDGLSVSGVFASTRYTSVSRSPS